VNQIALMRALVLMLLSVGAVPTLAQDSDWRSHDGSSDETAYSGLKQITKSNVQRLGLAWSLDLQNEQSLEATPLAVNGVLYFTGSHCTVYAVDGVTGKLLWQYDPEVWKHAPAKLMFTFAANRGAAYAEGRIFAASLDGRLFALDAKTGELLWSVLTVPALGVKTITGAPRAFNGKVIIGNGGADFGERGYVTAYEASSGKQLWRFYTTPGKPDDNQGDEAMERAAATWSGEYWKTGTGGGVWDSMTFDAQLNRIYLGTGNAGPYDPSKRSPGNGDNLYTASIVALDADSGKYLWHYQVVPRDAWDYDCTQQMTLADLVIHGQQRKVLMQAPKDGFFYVIDRRTGKLISAEKIGKVTWAERIDLTTGRPVEAPNIRYENGDSTVWPSPAGAHSWQSMSFSPKTGLVYIPTMQIGGRFHKGEAEPGILTFNGLGVAAAKADQDDDKGTLVAWDPVKQTPQWKVPQPYIWNGGTLATAGELVFQGTADGYFSAFNASTGKTLWRFNAGLGIVAAPMSYSVGGRQYVSILVGYGGSTGAWGEAMRIGWKFGVQPRRLLTFALDGKMVLPPTVPPDPSVKALDDPSLQLNPADVAAGRAQFNLMCGTCHGLELHSTGYPGPDLRESTIALNEKGMWAVLHEGTLLELGMPKYAMLPEEQVRQIYQYIRAGAREALAPSTPTSSPAGTQ
jgi:quinohemoprotein ethanol dehydrogenase